MTTRLRLTLAALGLLILAPAASAGETIPLDQEFSFRLEPPTPAPSAPALSADGTMRPDRGAEDALRTPEGERLPRGTQKRAFNGRTYYLIPL